MTSGVILLVEPFRHPARSICCGGALSHPHDDSFDASSERLETPLKSHAPPHVSPTLCPGRSTLEPSCTPAVEREAAPPRTRLLREHLAQMDGEGASSSAPPRAAWALRCFRMGGGPSAVRRSRGMCIRCILGLGDSVRRRGRKRGASWMPRREWKLRRYRRAPPGRRRVGARPLRRGLMRGRHRRLVASTTGCRTCRNSSPTISALLLGRRPRRATFE